MLEKEEIYPVGQLALSVLISLAAFKSDGRTENTFKYACRKSRRLKSQLDTTRIYTTLMQSWDTPT